MATKVRVQKNISWALQKRLTVTGSKFAKECAEYGKGVAQDLYQTAEYDGTVDDIKITLEENKAGAWWLMAIGPQVRAIEYGASGDSGRKVLYDRQTGKAFWFYKTPPGNRYGAGGEPKKIPRTRYKKDELGKAGYYKNKKEAMAAWREEWENDTIIRHDDYPGGFGEYAKEREEESRVYIKELYRNKDGRLVARFTSDRSDIRRHDDEENGVFSGLGDSKKYSVTHGNEPQKIMEKTTNEIIKEVQRRWKAHG